MLKEAELVKRPEYWLETIQNEIYRQVAAYLKDNNMTQTQLAIQLGVSKGYISQVMKGEFNYTLKKLIELSLAVGKAPVIVFKPLEDTTKSDKEEFSLPSSSSLDRVAEPGMPYTSLEE
ncbi:MAG: helix-turn-helix transcriptional regulator [Bacteroidia bacterium]|nr:helix-turn-helix transcriptional regulator [Bacteroidia bacterium]